MGRGGAEGDEEVFSGGDQREEMGNQSSGR